MTVIKAYLFRSRLTLSFMTFNMPAETYCVTAIWLRKMCPKMH